MRVRRCLVPLFGLVLFACGGSTDGDPPVDGVGGAGGTGGTAGSGGGGGTPSECEVASSGPGPHEVSFRFTNASAKPLFVLDECHTRYSITSCADGYQEPLAIWADCMQDCKLAGPGGCIACGACMWQGTEVTPSAPHQSTWSGKTFSFSQTGSGCQCYDAFAAPAGRYRIKVPVYASDEGAQNGDLLYEVEVPFTLPAPGGLVEVPLDD